MLWLKNGKIKETPVHVKTFSQGLDSWKVLAEDAVEGSLPQNGCGLCPELFLVDVCVVGRLVGGKALEAGVI